MSNTFLEDSAFLNEDDPSFFLNSNLGEFPNPLRTQVESPLVTPFRKRNATTENSTVLHTGSERVKAKEWKESDFKASPNLVSNTRELNQLDALKKENFALKLKLFHMEDRVSQQARPENLEDILKENIEQKTLLEERTKELEERNRLLMKARNAIETLQTDVELARAQSRTIRMNESQEIQKLNQMCLSYRQQTADIEQQSQHQAELIKSLQDKISNYQYKTDLFLEENEKLKDALQKKHSDGQSVKLHDYKKLEDQVRGLTTQLEHNQKELNAFKQEAAEKDFQLEVAIADHKLQIEEKNKFIQESMDTLESMGKKQQEMLDEMKLLKDSAARAEMEKDKLSAAFGLLDTKAKHEHAFKMEEMGKLGEEIMQKNLKLKDQIREIADKDLMIHKLSVSLDETRREHELTKDQIKLIEANYQEKLKRWDAQVIKHKEDHLVDVQKLKTEMEYILAQEIKKREESQRRVQQEVERLQEELKHMVAKQDERNQLLMQVDRTLNETLPDKAQLEYKVDKEFAIFQDKLLEKMSRIIRQQKQMASAEEKLSKNERELQQRLDDALEHLKKFEFDYQTLTKEANSADTQMFHLHHRLQGLELELEQKNLMLASWGKDKTELEETRALVAHNESERVQLHTQIQKLKEEVQALRRRELQLEEKVKDAQKYEDERKQLHQLKIELEVKKRIETDHENETKLLLERIHYLESQVAQLSRTTPSAQYETEIRDQNGNRMKDIQNKLDRLSENNRLLILELEEKRNLTQDMNRKYQTIFKENNELKSEMRHLKRNVNIGHAQEFALPELEQQILKQVEESKSLMMQSEQEVELEKKKINKIVSSFHTNPFEDITEYTHEHTLTTATSNPFRAHADHHDTMVSLKEEDKK